MRRRRARNLKKEGLNALPLLTDRSAFDVSEREFDALLAGLCMQMGFSIYGPAAQALWERKPATVDEFVDGLFAAEGLQAGMYRSLRSDVKQHVQAFIAARRAP